jgi:hypothetical protein
MTQWIEFGKFAAPLTSEHLSDFSYLELIWRLTEIALYCYCLQMQFDQLEILTYLHLNN